jgi:hypothetical protein
MAEGDAMPGSVSGCLEQGIVHAGDLFLHRFQRLANHSRTNFLSAQVADFFDLEQVEE